MSGQRISASMRLAVHARAKGFCEYCRIPELGALFGHEPDHIIAKQHGGKTILENLALACMQCNRCKGPNVASVDPETNHIVPLFNPRTERWEDHFRADGGRIMPLTAIGHATATLLEFGRVERVETRHNLWLAGHYLSVA
jgi:5-methylcytosine-specific restriction endonuclease McrA